MLVLIRFSEYIAYLCTRHKCSENMGTVAIIAIIVVGLSVVLLALGMILGWRKEFPSSHIDDSQPLKDKGITCARQQMEEAFHRKNLKERT